MTRWAIFDLDNCLADDEWRIGRIAWQHTDLDRRYHDYHSLAPFDAPGARGLRTVQWCRDAGARIAVFTARPVLYRAATAEWLARVAGFEPDALLMRNAADRRHSVELKAAQLRDLHAHWGATQVIAAFDDRPDVVEMYRANGVLSAAVLAIHSTCAYTPPEEHAA